MKIKARRILTISLTILVLPILLIAQPGIVKQVKLEKFELQSSALIENTGNEISSGRYQQKVYWFPVKVPCTVLTGLVANRVYPDPYTGMNNMLIPDASDEFNKQYNLEQYSHIPGEPNPWKKPYWYRTTFQVPATDQGRFFQLVFKGINYRAEVWLNGKMIADSTRMAGMFAEYNLDVSGQIVTGGKNVLAVKIFPLDYPGLPSEEQLKALGDFFANGGPTGDIGKNVTMLCSVGWDWIPPVRDRNMGIWQPVFLRISGKVTIDHPRIITELPNLPDTTRARMLMDLTLTNHQNSTVSGTLSVDITPENFTGHTFNFSQPVSLEAGSSKKIELRPEAISQLNLKNPRLWWPNGYGIPNLYKAKIRFEGPDGVSDEISVVTGIRTVDSKAVEVPGKATRRDFYVNGKRIHITGGAWVPDMMLNRDSARYAHELKLCQKANANLVRIWGGGITPPDIFWDICDRNGLLVWSDFWITGDTQGEFKGSPDWPLESKVFIDNMTSTILRIRNHPSLLVWTGGNEGHARKELYDAMRNGIIELDGTRPFIPSSSGFARLPEGWKGSWPDGLGGGVFSGGPYGWRDPHDYYDRANNSRDWVFKDETGIPSQPPYNTLQKIIPDLVWDKSLPFPLNHTWGYHDAATGNGRYDLYFKETSTRYGEFRSMEDFSNKAQLMNAVGYQGIFEAAGHKLNDIGGVMLWKLNAAFPSIVWQIYDWYLMPNAGYYFMQNACEPVHVQFNYDDSAVAAINRTYAVKPNLSATAVAYDLNGKLLFQKSAEVSLGATDVKEVISLSKSISGIKDVTIIILNLKDGQGRMVSHNTYWLAPSNDFTALNEMTETDVEVKLTGTSGNDIERKWDLNITNNSKQVAFFIRPQIMQDGEEIMPSFWSGGYITLAPSESMALSVSVPAGLVDAEKGMIRVSGWNVVGKEMPLNLK
ncbi:MAG TPA: glycoside hydrolase family 2 TIM barrel-domain containing protein [Cyclobacteriaceae bacterium]|nr:glycoside hydrolase family 2 TIM barrel-domain containing protein [Cyclobacteriaceae bacterium]